MGKIARHFFKALVSLISVSIVVVAVVSYFIFNNTFIGLAFLGIGVLNLIFMKIMKIELKYIYPDLTFGFVDNGVMVFAAIAGGILAGVPGAIIGGVAGNTITDGIGGFFEGYVSERQKEKQSLKVKEEHYLLL